MSSGDSGFSCCVLMAYLVCFICRRSICFIYICHMFDYITHSPTCWPALLHHCHGWLHHTQPPWARSNNCWLSLLPRHCVQFVSQLLLFVIAVYWRRTRMGWGDKTSTCGLTGVTVLCKMDFIFSERLCQENRRLQTPVCHRHQRPGPYLHAGEAARGSGPHQHRACQKGGESLCFCF